jgi:outer membrane protein
MKKLIIITCLASAVALSAGTAMADSINGKLGVTGRIGFLVPADHDNDTNPDAGFIGGGGLIYGIGNNVAADLEVTHTSFGSDRGDFGITDIALGGQYRFTLPDHHWVPFVGAGLDILVSDLDGNNGESLNHETKLGVHAKGGIDYFINKQFALTAEAKVVAASRTSIIDRFGDNTGDRFTPTNMSSTVGIRYFFN